MSRHQLNLLRQFARAASGDQLGGDELARLVVGDAGLTGEEGNLPAAQIAAFLKIWRRNAEAPRDASQNFTDKALWHSLPYPPENGRLMLLLCDVLGVPAAEAGRALDLKESEARRLLDVQRESLKFDEKRKAVLIEDEPMIRSDLAEVLDAMNIRTVGQADRIDEAIRLCTVHQPDIVIADYNLGDEKFDKGALARLKRATDAPVIFVTGYPDEVLTGETSEPDFVIAKPYRPEAIAAAAAHSLAASPRILVEQI